MKCLLDTPIKPSLRAIQFVSNNNNGGDTNSEGKKVVGSSTESDCNRFVLTL